MCTLIVAHRVPGYAPLLVADNRDENLDRPSAPAQWWTPEIGGPKIWSPRDLEAGGTWIGWSEHGVFAGLTNRFGERPDPDRRSRGEIVLEALMYPSASKAAEAIAAWGAGEVNPFHLIVSDEARAFLVWHTGESIVSRELPAGVHVITERSLGAAESGREDHVKAAIDTMLEEESLDLKNLSRLLGERYGEGFDDVFVHIPAINYGTRSSVLIEVEDHDLEPTLVYKEGGFGA